MEREKLRNQITEHLLDAENLLWATRRLVENTPQLSRSDIFHIRSLIEILEEKLRATDLLFDELVSLTPLKLEVANV